MTLVAALRIEDVPVLLGDFLLTESRKTDRNFLPTRTLFDGDGVPPPPRMVSKKIHKISDGFVLGFAGYVPPGTFLVSQIHTRFRGTLPSPSELQQFLSELKFHDKGKTELVGWLCGKKWQCFHWRGQSNSLELVDQVVAGSGAQAFSAAFNQSNFSGHGGLGLSVDYAAYKAVCNIGKTLATEVTSGANLSAQYGSGGEVLVWDGRRFSYIDDITYSFWSLITDRKGIAAVVPNSIVVRYKNYGEYSVIQTSQSELRGEVWEAQHTFVQAMMPMYAPDMPVELSRLPLESSILFANFLLIDQSGQNLASIPLVAERDDQLINYKGGHFNLNMRELGQLVEQVLRHV